MFNIVYELKDVKIELAQKLVDGLRVGGVKGVLAKPQYATTSKPVQDSLFAAAMTDARNNATGVAKLTGKSIGEVYNVNTGYSTVPYAEYDNVDFYNLSKFEINLGDNKIINVSVNVTFELKK